MIQKRNRQHVPRADSATWRKKQYHVGQKCNKEWEKSQRRQEGERGQHSNTEQIKNNNKNNMSKTQQWESKYYKTILSTTRINLELKNTGWHNENLTTFWIDEYCNMTLTLTTWWEGKNVRKKRWVLSN